MSVLLTLVRKDIANFLRNRAAVAITFLVPIALIYIFGQVFGINRKDSGPTGIPLAVVNVSGNPAADTLIKALQNEKSLRVRTSLPQADGTTRPLTEDDARALIRDRQLRFALILPADLVRTDGIGLRFKLLSDPRNEIETQTVNGLLQKTVFTSVPELLGASLQARAKTFLGDQRFTSLNGKIATALADTFGGDPALIQRDLESGDFIPDSLGSTSKSTGSASTGLTSLIRFENEQVVGKDVKSPEATRIVGGWAMMFLLFALSNGAAAFFDEQRTGIFRRLLAAPVSRAQILWSRFLYGVLLGVVQLTTLFLAGQLLYGIDVTGHLPLLLLVSVAAAAASTSFGMLLAAIAKTPQAASGLATFLVLTMSAIGGAWFPISLMPEFMQQLSKFTLVYWAMEGFAQVLWAGDGLTSLLPTLGVLVGIAGGVMWLAVWRLNRSRLFE